MLRFQTRIKRRGVTLVELLVVATIMLALAAASVPTIKPMMESKLTANAAASVSTYLDRAKFRAMTTGRPCGVTFEYFENTYDGGVGIDSGSASLVLRQVEVPPYYSGLEEGASVSVIRGQLYVPSDDPYWANFVANQNAPRIQFDSVGPFYPIEGNFVKSVAGADLPTKSRVSYKVIRDPKPTMTAPIGMPQGTVVDLEFSGTDSNLFERGRDVTIMFSPDGKVDYISLGRDQSIPADTIYLLIGRWDRIAALGTKASDYDPDELATAAEDGLWNYEDGSNFWVAINPNTGAITTAPVNQPVNYALGDMDNFNGSLVTDAIFESREFARTSKRNLGGR